MGPHKGSRNIHPVQYPVARKEQCTCGISYSRVLCVGPLLTGFDCTGFLGASCCCPNYTTQLLPPASQSDVKEWIVSRFCTWMHFPFRSHTLCLAGLTFYAHWKESRRIFFAAWLYLQHLLLLCVKRQPKSRFCWQLMALLCFVVFFLYCFVLLVSPTSWRALSFRGVLPGLLPGQDGTSVCMNVNCMLANKNKEQILTHAIRKWDEIWRFLSSIYRVLVMKCHGT